MDEADFNNFFDESKKIVDDNKGTLEWQTPEHEQQNRHADWYWGAGALVIFAIILCIIFGNLLLGLIILIGSFTLYLYEFRTPKIITIKITNKGVVVGNELYTYEKIKSFWITEAENNLPPRLLIDYDRILIPRITIYLEDMSPDTVREYLKKYGEEEEKPPSFSEAVSDALGF